MLTTKTPVIPFDAALARQDFPALQQTINGHPLVYLDNGATTQKPQAVLDAIDNYYRHNNANVHRGVHTLSDRATTAYENARRRVADFINAPDPRTVVFVRGTTEAINLIAHGIGSRLNAGDEILLTRMEHHSNIVPWQLAAERCGAILKVVDFDANGELSLAHFKQLLTEKTRFVSIVHASNALGTINPVAEIVRLAHAIDVPVLLDGAQAAPHIPIDVQALDCDFYCFSGHKVYGPTGIGVLYGKADWLERLPPYQGGGEMIASVRFEKTTYHSVPHKFEAGTPNIAGAVGLHAALDYLSACGLDAVAAHERRLAKLLTERLQTFPRLRLIGTAAEKVGVVSFVFEDIHAHDVGTILDQAGVAIRAGHHCAMPALAALQVPATVRASFGLYNTDEEVERLLQALGKVRSLFS